MNSKRKHNGSKQHKNEVRTLTAQLEARASTDGAMKLGGYCVRFNSPASIGGEFTETIAPNAFTRTLKEDDQVLLRDHQSQLLLGRKSAGTLRLTQDNTGLRFEADLPNTELGRDTYENVRLGNLKGCSFGFIVRDDVWTQDAQGQNGLNRLIKDVQMFEATITAFPAYESTTVNIRSVRDALERGVFSSDAIDDDDDTLDPACDPDDPAYDSGECDEDEDRSEVDVCSACGRPFDEDAEELERNAHMDLLLRRLR